MKVLVATDGSRGSRAALRFAARTARGCRTTEIVVVTVGALRRQLLFAHPDSPAGLVLWPELEKRERDLARRVLAHAARDVKKLGVSARCRFVQPRRLGPVAEAIAHEADKEKADLIVVGTEGHGALGGWALGSVSARLLHVARRPVAVVRVAPRKPARRQPRGLA
jgi:nucleotide-binding universal stress UspA family protein